MRLVLRVPVLLAATLTALAQVAGPPPASVPATAAATAPANLGEPTRITLHMRNKPLPEVVAALSKLADYPLTLPQMQSPNAAKVTVDLDQAPFWEAMRQLLDRADMGFPNVADQALGNPDVIPLGSMTSPWWLKMPYNQQGAYCVCLARTRWDDSYQPSFLTIEFMILMDPRTCVLRYGASLQDDNVTDNTGAQLRLSTVARGNNLRPPDRARWQVAVPARFRKPDDDITSIAHFRAAERLMVVTQRHTWEVNAADVAGARTELPWGTLSMGAIAFNGTTAYTLPCTFDYTPEQKDKIPGGIESIPCAIRLLDDQGRALVFRSVKTSQSTEGKLTWSYEYSTLMSSTRVERYGQPVKVQWEIADEVREVLVPIAFDDIPVPPHK